MDDLSLNYNEILNNIASAQKFSPYKQNVQLIAVSKTFTCQDITTLYNLGQRNFAENYALEFYNKAHELKSLDIEWHYIGTLQTNKIKYIAPYTSWIHSVEKASQILAISKYRTTNTTKLNILIQIKINNAPNQHGMDINNVQNILALIQLINTQINLVFRGFMGIASIISDNNILIQQFESLRKLADAVKSSKVKNVDTLSMGMSHDYKTAIMCGATQVRIGSKIFGTRTYR